jgi:hypothetical protein
MPVFHAGRTASARLGVAQILPMALLAAAIATFAVLGGCGSDKKTEETPTCSTSGHPEDFLPNNIQGWPEPPGSRLTATTAAELESIVDGGYQNYLRFGFQEFVKTDYSGSIGEATPSVTVEITELSSPEQAIALYNDPFFAPLTSEPVTPSVGDASRLTRSPGWLTIDFVECAYWVKLYINDSSDDGLSVLQAFAASIEQEMTQ